MFKYRLKNEPLNGKHRIVGNMSDFVDMFVDNCHVLFNKDNGIYAYDLTFSSEEQILNFFRNFVITSGDVCLIKDGFANLSSVITNVDSAITIYPGMGFVLVNCADEDLALILKLAI